MGTIISNSGNFFPFYKKVFYHMQFLKFLSPLKKRGLSYEISGISFPSPKTWTTICNLWNFFLFFENMDYHMLYLEFLSLLQKHGLPYAIYGISFSFLRI